MVHAHPPAVVLCSMAGIELRPIFGGYDPNSMRLSLKGIPVYPSTLTLNTKDQVHAMQKVMGASDVCVLRGHGLIVAGSSVEQATITAIKLDNLARMNLQAASLGEGACHPRRGYRGFSETHGKGKQLPRGLVEILQRVAGERLILPTIIKAVSEDGETESAGIRHRGCCQAPAYATYPQVDAGWRSRHRSHCARLQGSLASRLETCRIRVNAALWVFISKMSPAGVWRSHRCDPLDWDRRARSAKSSWQRLALAPRSRRALSR